MLQGIHTNSMKFMSMCDCIFISFYVVYLRLFNEKSESCICKALKKTRRGQRVRNFYLLLLFCK